MPGPEWRRSVTTQPQRARLLVALLRDPTARLDERVDAAMALWTFSGAEVTAALIRAALDPSEDDLIIETAAESLAEIWKRNDAFDHDVYGTMPAPARLNIDGVFGEDLPEPRT